MSIKIKLLIDEKEISVLRFSFGFNQSTDISNKPSQKPVFNGLKLTIKTEKDLNLAEWSFASNQTKQLELHIYPIILGAKTRKLYLYDCHLIGWKNDFSATGTHPLRETLIITCAGIKDSNSTEEYSAYWRETFTNDSVTPTAMDNETLPNLINYHFEDEEENEIRKKDIRIDDVFYLVIHSENAIGESVTINLDDNFKDYEYNNNRIINDVLKDVIISDDICKLKLKAIKQQN
ncbi:type VI secretion system tube protein TssD [Olleya sp. Bg11-27]|uniref:type VI secretion system tube protein TssD n=1 Tax=Olleya sp. Bg11-27 TaxID=2058135 RepID=UPI000C31B70F|nr:type VI secretion system tube protein TssD [Olleya sp. Bg11-27]AUC74921.1 hypothetical protein CW732_04205 [Olleya sp. Bg11-27]